LAQGMAVWDWSTPPKAGACARSAGVRRRCACARPSPGRPPAMASCASAARPRAAVARR